MPSIVKLILSFFPHQPTQGQYEACESMARFLFDADPRSAYLLRGYAGTGKTSLVSALIQAAPHLKVNTVLLAPTGRAAKVLSGYSHRQAFTIHKKIYTTLVDANGMVHTVRAKNKYSYTLFIVDEASMINAMPEEGDSRRALLDDLVDYVYDGNHCRLMLIGDDAQLPPVGSSYSAALSEAHLTSVLGLKVHHALLSEVVRQEKLSGILHNATFLRALLSNISEQDPVPTPLFDVAQFNDIVRLDGSDLEESLFKEYDAVGTEGVVFISRSNKRANLFNQAIRNRILLRDDEVGTGDYLMVVKNNYHWLDDDSTMSFIANGDIVEVLSARNFQELYGFHFVDVTLRLVDYPDERPLECKLLLEVLHSDTASLTRDESQRLFSEVMADYADLPTKAERLQEVRKNPYFNALQVKFAYSLTCHKTQGGQWPVVYVDQGYLSEEMINRDFLRWLYTALTRATSRVYLLNFNPDFFHSPLPGGPDSKLPS